MKKYFLGFYFILLISFLAACISIPIGDGTLEISGDGIEFVEGNEAENNNEENNNDENEINNDEENNNENEENQANENDEDNANNENEPEENETLENNENNTNENAEENESSENEGDQGEELGVYSKDCEVQDHSKAMELIEGDFSIPKCAVLTSLGKRNNTVNIDFTIENADWEELSNAYVDYFDDKITWENLDVLGESNDMTATLDNEASVRVQINQDENDIKGRIQYENP